MEDLSYDAMISKWEDPRVAYNKLLEKYKKAIKPKYIYSFKSESGDEYLIETETYYETAPDFMKGEGIDDYEGWRSRYDHEDIPYASFERLEV